MATANLFLRTDKVDSHGKSPVYLQISHQGKRIRLSIEESIKPQDIDKNAEGKGEFKVKPQLKHIAPLLNPRFEEIEFKLTEILRERKLSRIPFTAEDIRKDFLKVFNPGRLITAAETDCFAEEFITEWIDDFKRKRGWAKDTVRSYKDKIGSFLTFVKSKKLKINNLTEPILNKYVDYLFDVKKDEPGYIRKEIESLKLFLQYCKQRGIDTRLEQFIPERKIKVIKKPPIRLTPDEYNKLYAYQPSSARLEKAKDMYIILHNTTLRWSDSKIDQADVVSGKIRKTMHKTQKTVHILQNDDLKTVLQKYNYNPPRIARQSLNDDLKDLFKEAGIDTLVKVITYKGGIRKEEVKHKYEIVSSKWGRKSMVSQLYNMGFSEKWIRDNFTGHASMIEMDVYIDTNDEQIEAQYYEKMKRDTKADDNNS